MIRPLIYSPEAAPIEVCIFFSSADLVALSPDLDFLADSGRPGVNGCKRPLCGADLYIIPMAL